MSIDAWRDERHPIVVAVRLPDDGIERADEVIETTLAARGGTIGRQLLRHDIRRDRGGFGAGRRRRLARHRPRRDPRSSPARARNHTR